LFCDLFVRRLVPLKYVLHSAHTFRLGQLLAALLHRLNLICVPLALPVRCPKVYVPAPALAEPVAHGRLAILHGTLQELHRNVFHVAAITNRDRND